MRFGIVILMAVSALWAADEQQLALVLKAQTDFDRMQLATTPQLRETSACIQSQAALLPVTPRTEVPLIHFRKGLCTLIGATITHQAGDFTAAAAEFDAAVQTWPARLEKPPKGILVEPVASAVPVLAGIARLEAEPDDATKKAVGKAIADALAKPACSAGVMSVADCQAILQVGRQWLGWIALRDNRLDEAAQYFSGNGWPEWVAARQAFEQRNYSRAVEQYRRAIQAWNDLISQPAPTLPTRLGPHPDMGSALTDLGGAELVAGHTTEAIATLDSSIKRAPGRAWTFYLRARAKDAAGQTDAAFSDYNLASRTAFAGAQDLVSGEAHLYRGVMLYRRKDFVSAEDEFSSALNFEIPANLRPDAVAWRHLAAVAQGSCTAARDELQRALPAASPYFPIAEAQTAIAACPTTAGALP